MDRVPSSLRSAIFDLESPLTDAEGAVVALNMIAQGLGSGDEAAAIAYLGGMIRTHLNDLRERFDHVSSFKGDQPAA